MAVRDYHLANGFPDTERTRAGFARDHGDLHPLGDRSVIAQCKNVRAWRLPEWLDQLADQIRHAGATHGYLVVKRPRVADPGQAYVVTTLDQHLALLREAGYGERAREAAATSVSGDA